MKKCGRTGQAIENKMAHVHCMLITTRICNTFCFSIGTIVLRNASFLHSTHIACLFNFGLRVSELYEGLDFNSGNYLFTTDTK